jgi:2-keto-3-deoxy-galactonokinase
MELNTPGSLSKFVMIINKEAPTYNTTINGTIFSVVWPILLIPPTITKATITARIIPYR